jgi:hypothetical protein
MAEELVRDVPATVCLQCGEEWINDEAASMLKEIVTLAKRQKQKFFITRFDNYSLTS